jgi:hypothetical protein
VTKSVFYSFHYDRDFWRVQQVRNMGLLEGQPVVNAQDWESVKREGNASIQNWIELQMSHKSAVVVLVGSQTADRPWVRREIAYAWNNKKPLVGIHINGLENQAGLRDGAGANPFQQVSLKGGGTVGDYVSLHQPYGGTSEEVYASIKENLLRWVEDAYRRG